MHGKEVWGSDGTEAGTALIADLYAGGYGSNPTNFTPAGDKLFFTAGEPSHGGELWVLYRTLDGELSCTPESGVLPFSSQFTIHLHNTYAGQSRRFSGALDALLAGGGWIPNWKAGYTNVAASSAAVIHFPVNFPNLSTLVGDNTFTLRVADVTPAPFNQPPYPPAGDTDREVAVVTGIAP